MYARQQVDAPTGGLVGGTARQQANIWTNQRVDLLLAV
jgi:hypothetical protein